MSGETKKMKTEKPPYVNQDLIDPNGLSKVSSVYKNTILEPIRNQETQWMAKTWQIAVFLVICLFVLKTFIYIKDAKRWNK